MMDDEIAPVPLAARLAWLATERAWRVLDARAGFESRLTYAAIGRELGITRGRAWQLHIDLGHRLAHPSLPPGSPAGHPGHARRRLAPARPRRPPRRRTSHLPPAPPSPPGRPNPAASGCRSAHPACDNPRMGAMTVRHAAIGVFMVYHDGVRGATSVSHMTETTGRQGDRATGRQGDRATDRQIDRSTGRQGDRATEHKRAVSLLTTTAVAALFALWPGLSRHYATTCPLLWTRGAPHATEDRFSSGIGAPKVHSYSRSSSATN